MKVMYLGELLNMETGRKVFVGRVAGGRTVFGEMATLVTAGKNSLIYKTESGSTVKTDYNMNTIGKAKKSGYFVSPKTEREYISEAVKYWNKVKQCLENK